MSERRTRGPNRKAPWVRSSEDGVSVLRLALDASDPVHRTRIEAMFRDAFVVRRALQSDARARARAYRAASNERSRDADTTRDRLGLSRTALEHAAYKHINAAPHLRRFVTKALAMHLADSVWSATERHLFRDARGKTSGMPRIGRWFDFRRLPGRARSHTTARKWETFRLHGSLEGHRSAAGGHQPRPLHPASSRGWWRYEGPLVVVFSGLATGMLVLPVRLPSAPSNQEILDHHLADPSRWHKIDLIRERDPSVPGGWRYEAHLMVLMQPYVSSSATTRRANVAIATVDRRAGIDVNVSNISVASHDDGVDLRVTRIERDATQQQRDRRRSRRERQRQRDLDRSRRSMNRAQYQLSKRQEKRARRRSEQGLAPIETIPMGPRVANAAGVPRSSYRRDALSAGYRRLRAVHAADAAAAGKARRDRARQVAAEVVATHGYQLVVEDGSIAAWSRSWGRALAAFSPGLLIAAIDREARAVAALTGRQVGLERASTRTTAMSQHCPCGARVPKKLGERVHDCASCKLRGDRDAVAAILGSFVVFGNPGDQTSARVDFERATSALPQIRRALDPHNSLLGWQDTLSESNDLSAREGCSLTWWMSTPDSVAVARRIVGTAPSPTLDETGLGQTTSDRRWMRTNLPRRYVHWTYLRDSS